MAASTVPVVEDALLARLQARTGLLDVLVMLGLPAKVPENGDRIYILGVQDNQRQRRVEQGQRRESYVLPLWIEVYRPDGDDRSGVRDRFWELVDEVESDLADDPELANVADDSEVEEVVEMNILPTGDGWVAKGLLNIRVLAVV